MISCCIPNIQDKTRITNNSKWHLTAVKQLIVLFYSHSPSQPKQPPLSNTWRRKKKKKEKTKIENVMDVTPRKPDQMCISDLWFVGD